MGVKQFVQYELPGKIDDLNSDLSLIGGDVSDLSSSIDTELGELQTAIDEQLVGLGNSIGGVVGNVKVDLTALISALDTKVNSVNTAVNSVNTAIANIKPAVKSVQRGMSIGTTGNTMSITIPISAVNMAKTMVFATGWVLTRDNTTGEITQVGTGDDPVVGWLSNNTTLCLACNGSNFTYDSMAIVWQLVEYN